LEEKVMNWKKTLVVLVSFAMAATTFAGCKNYSATNTTASNDSGPKPTLKALVAYKSGMDFNNNPVQKYLEEKTGYKIQYDTLPADNPNDKLNAIMASGTDYDFVIVWDKGRYADYAQQGALTDLKPLVAKYGSNISKNITTAMFDIVTVDKSYYCIPTISPSGKKDSSNVNTGIMVRQDLLDKMGLSTPKTLDDFTNILQQIKDKDPNGQGSKNIPLTLDQKLNDVLSCGIGGAFGIANKWTAVSGKLVPRVEMPGFKAYVQYMKDLYTKGLLDKETPTNQGMTAKEKFTSGRAFAFVDTWSDVPQLKSTLATTQPSAKVQYIPPVSGQYGKAAYPAASVNSFGTYTIIPKGTKHAADVIKYINVILTEDIFKGLVIGMENVDHTVKDGAYYPILPIFFNDRGNADCYLMGATKSYGTYWLCRARKDDNQYAAYAQINFDFGQYVSVNPDTELPCSISAGIAAEQIAVDNLSDQFVIQSVTGVFSDATFNTFLASWKSQGGDDIVKKMNDWYTSSKKK
jgi:putative aldouronate transport system substrate-binding protein